LANTDDRGRPLRSYALRPSRSRPLWTTTGIPFQRKDHPQWTTDVPVARALDGRTRRPRPRRDTRRRSSSASTFFRDGFVLQQQFLDLDQSFTEKDAEAHGGEAQAAAIAIRAAPGLSATRKQRIVAPGAVGTPASATGGAVLTGRRGSWSPSGGRRNAVHHGLRMESGGPVRRTADRPGADRPCARPGRRMAIGAATSRLPARASQLAWPAVRPDDAAIVSRRPSERRSTLRA
jgi:hypothetical protein